MEVLLVDQTSDEEKKLGDLAFYKYSKCRLLGIKLVQHRHFLRKPFVPIRSQHSGLGSICYRLSQISPALPSLTICLVLNVILLFSASQCLWLFVTVMPMREEAAWASFIVYTIFLSDAMHQVKCNCTCTVYMTKEKCTVKKKFRYPRKYDLF